MYELLLFVVATSYVPMYNYNTVDLSKTIRSGSDLVNRQRLELEPLNVNRTTE